MLARILNAPTLRVQLYLLGQVKSSSQLQNIWTESKLSKHFPGNDLARVLRWGPGYGGDEDPLSLLKDVIDAEEIRLDRWTVVFRYFYHSC